MHAKVSKYSSLIFYKEIEAVHKQYKKGGIMIALDIDGKGAKSFALLPNTLAAQTLIMSSIS